MPIGNKKPRGFLLCIFRLPIWLYRIRLGWVLGERFLLLAHTGRKSGRLHQTIIEVVRHDRETDTYFVASGFGYNSDWFLNIKQNPNVAITINRRTLTVRARLLSESKAAKELLNYANRHPIAFRELSLILSGKSIEATEEHCLEFAKSVPIIALESDWP